MEFQLHNIFATPSEVPTAPGRSMHDIPGKTFHLLDALSMSNIQTFVRKLEGSTRTQASITQKYNNTLSTIRGLILSIEEYKDLSTSTKSLSELLAEIIQRDQGIWIPTPVKIQIGRMTWAYNTPLEEK